jgi:hypothetical protein
MITRKHFAALIGFAFVAAWIGFDFGSAVLCLVGAAVFYSATSYLEGEVDLAELQARFAAAAPRRPPSAPVPRRPRVR